jgi:hypothetical protein
VTGRPLATALPQVHLELAAQRGRVQLPQHLPEQLVAEAAEQALGFGVDVGEAPLGVQRHEPRRRRLQHARGLGLPVVHVGRVVRRAQHALGGAAAARHRPATRRDPPRRAVGPHDPVLHRERAAGLDRRLQHRVHARQVVGVQAVVEVRDGPPEVGRVVAEHRQQPVVPQQLTGAQVPLEAADARGLDRQAPAVEAALVLGGQRRELQLRDDRGGQLRQQVDVAVAPGARGRIGHAQRADRLTARGHQRDAEVGGHRAVGHRRQRPDALVACGVLDSQRARLLRGRRAEHVAADRAAAGVVGGGAVLVGDGLHVGEQRDLRRAGAEQSPGKLGEAVQRRPRCPGEAQDIGMRRGDRRTGWRLSRHLICSLVRTTPVGRC